MIFGMIFGMSFCMISSMILGLMFCMISCMTVCMISSRKYCKQDSRFLFIFKLEIQTLFCMIVLNINQKNKKIKTMHAGIFIRRELQIASKMFERIKIREHFCMIFGMIACKLFCMISSRKYCKQIGCFLV